MSHFSFDTTLEELGKSNLCAKVRVHCSSSPGEKRTHDYPGSPPDVWIDSIELLGLAGKSFILLSKHASPEWWRHAEKAIENAFLCDPGLEETASERLYDEV
jgi:hypothetical protein